MGTFVRRDGRRCEGFTLIEVLIAFTILAGGLLVIAAMQLHALRGGRSGRHTSQAVQVAEDQIETFQWLPYASLSNTVGFQGANVVTEVVDGSTTQIEQSYTVDWQISDAIPGYTKNIDVRVTWNEPDRTGRTLEMSTRRYNW